MIDTFRKLMKREQPEYIVSFQTETCDKLNAVTCKYRKGGKYFAATSFYTDTWLSSSPAGPLAGGAAKAECLEDIAQIREFETMEQCAMFSGATTAYLKECMASLRSVVDSKLSDIFSGPWDDKYSAKLYLGPVPCIVIKVKTCDGNLLGTLVVLPKGNTFAVTVCDERLSYYVAKIKSRFTRSEEPSVVGGIKALALGEGV